MENIKYQHWIQITEFGLKILRETAIPFQERKFLNGLRKAILVQNYFDQFSASNPEDVQNSLQKFLKEKWVIQTKDCPNVKTLNENILNSNKHYDDATIINTSKETKQNEEVMNKSEETPVFQENYAKEDKKESETIDGENTARKNEVDSEENQEIIEPAEVKTINFGNLKQHVNEEVQEQNSSSSEEDLLKALLGRSYIDIESSTNEDNTDEDSVIQANTISAESSLLEILATTSDDTEVSLADERIKEAKEKLKRKKEHETEEVDDKKAPPKKLENVNGINKKDDGTQFYTLAERMKQIKKIRDSNE